MKFFPLVSLVTVPLLCSVVYAQDAPADFDLSQWKPGGVTLEQAPAKRTRLAFEPWEWPNVRFIAPSPRDWTGRGVELETFNASTKPIELFMRIDDDVDSDGWRGCRTAKMVAEPGKAQKWLISLGADPMSYGMRGLPPVRLQSGATVIVAEGAAPLNTRHIMAWQLFLAHPQEKTSLDVGTVKLVPSPDAKMTGIADAFGQYAGEQWPGKIRSLAELKNAQTSEERELNEQPRFSNRDRFGGQATGPKFDATGFFRTQKEGERWWLVTPEGNAFWSAGVDVVQSAEPTITTAREAMFVSLPKEGEPLAAFRGEENNVLMGPQKGNKVGTFDFYRANLWRKYGDDWRNRWTLTALQRLRSWGFNTIGNWSDDGLHDTKLGEARVPYTVPVYLWGTHKSVPSEGAYWAPMHDPFDPQFALDVAARVGEAMTVAKSKSDPYCLGYFVDNELSWGGFDDKDWKTRYGLATGALNLGGDAPAKAAFVADLKAKYPSIEALNLAWKTQFASWDALAAPFKVTESPNEAQAQDFSAYLTHFADQYFQTVRDALRKADPNHLYLGCRFAWRNPEAIASAAKWCDVVTFNIYAPRVEEKDWGFTTALNKPILIGEFHMGALDRGMFHPGLVKANDQNERAQMFADYLQSAARRPNFVGAHWFQYTDEALTGRPFDGENFNIGFVTATDTPYPEMVRAAREANAHIYDWHAGK